MSGADKRTPRAGSVYVTNVTWEDPVYLTQEDVARIYVTQEDRARRALLRELERLEWSLKRALDHAADLNLTDKIAAMLAQVATLKATVRVAS